MISSFPIVELPSWSWGSALFTIVGAPDWPLTVTHPSQHDTALVWMWIMQWVATNWNPFWGSSHSPWICLVFSDLVCPHPKLLVSSSHCTQHGNFQSNINTIPVNTNTNVFLNLFIPVCISIYNCILVSSNTPFVRYLTDYMFRP
jgi:hypothetical protein